MNHPTITIVILIIVMGLVPGNSDAEEIRVPQDFGTIQEAIDIALDGDTILVDDGVYTGPGNTNIDPLSKEITIQSAHGNENCIISGSGTDRLFNIHMVEDRFTIIRGFTLRDGYSSDYGGGIYIDGASPWITECLLENCHARRGGGIYINNSNGSFRDSEIINCSADEKGGGAYCAGSEHMFDFSNCTFTDCESQIGGGAFIGNTPLSSFWSCEFHHNLAHDSGGGIACEKAWKTTEGPELNGCLFRGNSAATFGGGVYTRKTVEFIIDTCEFDENEARHGGGYYSTNDEELTLTASTFTSNRARTGAGSFFISSEVSGEDNIWTNNKSVDSGGAIFSDGDTSLILNNGEFRENSAKDGGAVYLMSYSIPEFNGIQFISNHALNAGGAVFYRRLDGGTSPVRPKFYNCEFRTNRSNHWGGAFAFGSWNNNLVYSTSIRYSIFEKNHAVEGSDLACFGTGVPIHIGWNTFYGNLSLNYFVIWRDSFTFEENVEYLVPINQDVYVKPDGDNTNDGLSWATAFQTIQHATSVLDTNSGVEHTIHVAAGTYSPTSTGELFPIPLQSGVHITGAESAENTVIDAEQTGSVFVGHISGNCNISNLTISGGESWGGGGFCLLDTSEIRIEYCKIINNHALGSNPGWPLVHRISGGGGGIRLIDGELTVNNTLFENNHSQTLGGAAYVTDSDSGVNLHVRNTFKGNTAGSGTGAVLACDLDSHISATYNHFEYNYNSDAMAWPQNRINLNQSTYQKELLSAATVYVSPTGSDQNSGLSPTEAFQTLQHAVKVTDTSLMPSTIQLDSGVYSSSQTGEKFPIPLRSKLTLMGNETRPIIDAEQQARVFSAENIAETYISKLVIQNGHADEAAGLKLKSSDVNMVDMEFRANTATFKGGAVFIDRDSRCNMSNLSFTENSAGTCGGGFFSESSSTSEVSDSIFLNNQSSNGGGAYIGGFLSTLTDCEFRGNTARYGGGLVCSAFISTNRGCLLTENSAAFGGGIVNHNLSSTYYDSIIHNNHATEHGGGLMLDSGSFVNLYNCLFSENSATNAGALSLLGNHTEDPTTAELHSCTVARNFASQSVGGISAISDFSSTLVRNSILWNNEHEQITSNSSVTVEYSNVQNGWPGPEPGNIDADPLFITGPQGDYYLSQQSAGQPYDSACVDMGSDSAAQVCYPGFVTEFCMDQRTTRTDEINDIDIVDMGFHYQADMSPPVTPTPTITPEHTATPTPTITPTITPEHTVTPTPTIPTPQPTITPRTGVQLELSGTMWLPGDMVYCRVCVTNIDSLPITGPLFVILDVFGDLFFAPEFNEFSYFDMSFSTGSTWVDVLAPFVWPTTGTSADGVFFHAALTDAAITEIIGEWDSREFGWQ